MIKKSDRRLWRSVKIISINRGTYLGKIILAILIFSIVSITLCEAISESPIETNETNTTVTIPPSLENRTDQLSGPLSGLFMIDRLKSQNISPQFFDSLRKDNGIIRARVIYPNISNYTDSYYVYKWIDSNGDGFVDLQEIDMAAIAQG